MHLFWLLAMAMGLHFNAAEAGVTCTVILAFSRSFARFVIELVSRRTRLYFVPFKFYFR